MVCACIVIGVAAPAPQDQEDVRGAFLTSRPKDKPAGTGTTAKPSRRRPRPAPSDSGTPSKPPEKKPGGSTGPSGSNKPSDTKPVNVARLGLGMTLFTRDSNGLAVRVDPEHVFRKGDRVRV
jgi:hypothetical protein